MTTIPLRTIACARSGDKGSSANIGLIPYTSTGYTFLKTTLGASAIKEYFSSLNPAKVTRYEIAGIEALNFVLEGVLDGGGSRSLRVDSQGKALASALLEMTVEVPAYDLDAMRRPDLVEQQ